jgi:hypothetical protein
MTQPLKPNEPSVNLSVRMPTSMYSTLKALAGKRGSTGELVRQAITEFLANKDAK